MIDRFDAIEQLAADSPGGAADQKADQPATGEWGPAMRVETPTARSTSGCAQGEGAI
jgi:hypothetical protein